MKGKDEKISELSKEKEMLESSKRNLEKEQEKVKQQQ